LPSFKLQIGGFIAFFVFAILGPLVMFTPGMARTKRKGLSEYGLLAQRFVESFEQKWVLCDPASSGHSIGTEGIEEMLDPNSPHKWHGLNG
jgi:hypothetical protein